jgi:hypothetical protein
MQNMDMFEQATANFMNRRVKNTRILEFVAQDVTGFKPQVLRPYKTTLDGNIMDTIVNTVAEDISRTGKVNPVNFTRASSGFLMPSALHTGIVGIPNGWDTSRLRFILRVESELFTGSIVRTYITGFTTHYGIGINNSVDPHMEFHVNNIVESTVQNVETVQGTIQREIVTGCFQAIDGVMIRDNTSIYANQGLNNNLVNGMSFAGMQNMGGMAGMDMGLGVQPDPSLETPIVTLRPSDVLLNINATNTSNSMNSIGIEHNYYTDTRLLAGDKRFISNERSNNNPLSYMVNLINSYTMSANEISSSGFTPESAHSVAYNKFADSSVTTNVFLQALNKIRGTRGDSAKFTLGDLCALVPTAEQQFIVMRTSPASTMNMNPLTDSENLTGATLAHSMVATLSQSVPAMMSKYFIKHLHIIATNQVIGGDVPSVIIVNLDTMIQIDITPYIPQFIERIKREILDYVSQANLINYDMTIDCYSFGSTTINISVCGEPHINFIIPSFCDSLFSPVVSNDRNSLNLLSADVDHILNSTMTGQYNVGPDMSVLNF